MREESNWNKWCVRLSIAAILLATGYQLGQAKLQADLERWFRETPVPRTATAPAGPVKQNAVPQSPAPSTVSE